MVGQLEQAVRANAAWCDLVCRASGLRPARTARVWRSSIRSPPGYPDAISLGRDADAEAVLADIDRSPGCSVKDSYARLALGQYGFDVLFDAHWICARPEDVDPSIGPECGWRTGVDLRDHIEPDSELGSALGVLPASVFANDAVSCLIAGDHKAVLGAAVAHRQPDTVALSHVWFASAASTTLWRSLLTVVRQLHPDIPIVGYESGSMLDTAVDAGCRSLGPLRVWMVPDGSKMRS